MTNDFKPDFSCIGQTIYTRGDEATVSGPSVFLRGGEFFPVRMEEGERFGETLLLPARAVRIALRLSYQVRVF